LAYDAISGPILYGEVEYPENRTGEMRQRINGVANNVKKISALEKSVFNPEKIRINFSLLNLKFIRLPKTVTPNRTGTNNLISILNPIK